MNWQKASKDNIPKTEVLCANRHDLLVGYLHYDERQETFICSSEDVEMHDIEWWMTSVDVFKSIPKSESEMQLIRAREFLKNLGVQNTDDIAEVTHNLSTNEVTYTTYTGKKTILSGEIHWTRH